MTDDNRCPSCIHCRKCKTLGDGKWIIFHICDYLANGPDGCFIVVTEDNWCEGWIKK